MSYAEKEKGKASDSFKRACFNWGIGRELYTAPFIWISAELANIQKKERESKYFTYERFHVISINYDEEGNINALSIVNEKNQIVYTSDLRKLASPDRKPDKVNPSQKKEASTQKKEAAKKLSYAGRRGYFRPVCRERSGRHSSIPKEKKMYLSRKTSRKCKEDSGTLRTGRKMAGVESCRFLCVSVYQVENAG